MFSFTLKYANTDTVFNNAHTRALLKQAAQCTTEQDPVLDMRHTRGRMGLLMELIGIPALYRWFVRRSKTHLQRGISRWGEGGPGGGAAVPNPLPNPSLILGLRARQANQQAQIRFLGIGLGALSFMLLSTQKVFLIFLGLAGGRACMCMAVHRASHDMLLGSMCRAFAWGVFYP